MSTLRHVWYALHAGLRKRVSNDMRRYIFAWLRAHPVWSWQRTAGTRDQGWAVRVHFGYIAYGNWTKRHIRRSAVLLGEKQWLVWSLLGRGADPLVIWKLSEWHHIWLLSLSAK